MVDKALLESIKHWEENVAASSPITVNTRADACALCVKYRAESSVEWCGGCPVFADTGQKNCRATPYTGAMIAKDNWDRAVRNRKWDTEQLTETREAWRIAAQKELDYLKSLLK
mgnify:CR=1 FL=1